MSYASVRGAAEEAAKAGRLLPHQLAALSRHDERLTEEQRREFSEDWRSEGSPAAPAPAPRVTTAPVLVSKAQAEAVFLRPVTADQLADLNACLARFQITTPARIRHFLAQIHHESGGLRWLKELASGEAYEGRDDLGNTEPGDGPRFRGAGVLQLTGRANYQALADVTGDPRVMEGCDYVAATYPFTSAGVWWARNGINAHVDAGSNCRRISALVNGRDPANGLAVRLAAYERALAAIGGSGAKPAQVAKPGAPQPTKRPLAVPYYRQTDSKLQGEHDSSAADEMCFSSTCAMAVNFLRPGRLAGAQPDDTYLQMLRAQGGRTTDPQAHVRLLNGLGIPARFITNGDWSAIERQLAAGIPVPVGWLHHGPASRPTGGGHWSLVVDLTTDAVVMHDPNGEADLVNGGYLANLDGKGQRYSRKNWGPRWLVDGPQSGWMLELKRPG